MIGASDSPVCGVRDYAQTLRMALEARGVRVSTHWLEMGGGDRPMPIRSWLASFDKLVREEQPHWILWHYSVFTYGHRGVPLLAPLVASRLRRVKTPLVGFLHEYAYPYGHRGMRGMAQATTQRVALAYVYRAVVAAVVTTECREVWLGERRWLPWRPTLFLPVCASVVFDDVHRVPENENGMVVGIIGFGSDTYVIDPIVEAVAKLRGRHPCVRLVLVGAPGPEHALAQAWRESAVRYGLRDALAFTGLLSADEYVRAVTGVDIVVFPDPEGPASRKTTLAVGLAAGKPTVALDGPGTWRRAVDEGAVAVVPADATRIEQELVELSENKSEWSEAAARASAFYQRWQAPHVLASRLLDFLESIPPRRTAIRAL